MNKKKIRKIIIFVVGSVLFLGVFTAAFYFYNQYAQAKRELNQIKKSDQTKDKNKEEEKELIEIVGKLIMLPADETPIIATVSDVSKLKDQAFFKVAQNGDKVLIYTKAKKAIMFRPSINKIVDVGPVSQAQITPTALPTSTVQVSTTPKPSPSVTSAKEVKKARVVLLNGTDTVGITYTVEKELPSSVKDIEIVDKDNAVKSDYKKTIIVDLSSGKFKDKAQELATFLKGEVGVLPEGEKKPDADILVILSQ